MIAELHEFKGAWKALGTLALERLSALRRVATIESVGSSTPDWQPWIVYFLRALQQQKKRLVKKIERERIIVDTLLELSVQILELAKDQDKVTISQIVKLTQANRNTIKKLNEADTQQCKSRDQSECQKLIDQQLRERREIQHDIRLLRHQHGIRIKKLNSDIGTYLKLSPDK